MTTKRHSEPTSELLASSADGVVRLTLNRPERRNALTPELIDRLVDRLDAVDADPDARAVVITGAAPAFCAGFDIALISSPGQAGAGAERDLVEALCSRVRRVRVPVVAMVNGVASGAGCDLAVSCDLRFAAEEARLAMPPAKLGLLYSWEGTARLVDTVGPAAAKELLLAGEAVDARRALQIGLVDRVYPAGDLEAETERFVAAVAQNAPLSVTASKAIVNLLSERTPSAEALAAMDALARTVWESEDSREGPQAFRERRTARFTGR